jgi:16S rRNA (guanine(966)-N(2))-methyltransferase RsmD
MAFQANSAYLERTDIISCAYVRITGGKLKGRTIRVPRGKVRPTQDRVREALFSILGDRVVGAAFLDLFAGSGAVGIEAWSRGARSVCWVEADARVVKGLRENVGDLCGTDKGVVVGNAAGFLRGLPAGTTFDIIFADPPYGGTASGRAERRRSADEDSGWAAHGVTHNLLRTVAEGNMLAPGGLFVIEERAGQRPEAPPGWQLADERRYGDTTLQFYRRVRDLKGVDA